MAGMNIKPTRSELIKLKKRIKLAKSGYNLLKKKRDGLILEFFEVLKKAKTIRKELVEAYKEAKQKIAVARAVESDLKLKSLALAIQDKPEVFVREKNIMGVRVPEIDRKLSEKQAFEKGFGVIGSSAKIDDAINAYEMLLKSIIEVAEIETTMKKLLDEIETTKRRVNALEFEVIPKMEDIKAFITLRLEEMERENIFRLKRIKQKSEA